MPRGRHGRAAHRMVRHGRDSNEAQIIYSGATRLANPGSRAASISAARRALSLTVVVTYSSGYPPLYPVPPGWSMLDDAPVRAVGNGRPASARSRLARRALCGMCAHCWVVLAIGACNHRPHVARQGDLGGWTF